MVYSDTTNKLGIVEDMAFLCGGKDGTPPGDYVSNDYKRNIRERYRRILALMLQANKGWKILNQTATADVVASQRSYQFSAAGGFNISDLVQMKKVEITYDGSNWYRAVPVDTELFDNAESGSTFDADEGLDDESEPKYSLREDYIDFYPKPTQNVTAGIKIYYTEDVETFGDTDSDIPKIPVNFHRVLSLGAAYDYLQKDNQAKSETVLRDLTIIENELYRFLGIRNEDERMFVSAANKNYK